MHSVLKDIVARKTIEVALAREAVPLEVLQERISELGRPRNFFKALVDRRHPDLTHVIAEIKRKSPSAGVIREDFDPPALARAYAAGGAACLSVLTDGPSFQGAPADLIAAREACELPVIRKGELLDLQQAARQTMLKPRTCDPATGCGSN